MHGPVYVFSIMSSKTQLSGVHMLKCIVVAILECRKIYLTKDMYFF